MLAIPNQLVQVGTAFTFAVSAGNFADPDFGDALTLSLAANPSTPGWLNFNAATGVFTGTPTATGIYPVGVVATDIYGASVTNQFTISSTAVNGVVNNFLSAVLQSTGGNQLLNMNLTGTPGSNYRIQQATNLVGAVWVDVGTVTADGNGVITISVTNPPSPAFYRTVTP